MASGLFIQNKVVGECSLNKLKIISKMKLLRIA